MDSFLLECLLTLRSQQQRKEWVPKDMFDRATLQEYDLQEKDPDAKSNIMITQSINDLKDIKEDNKILDGEIAPLKDENRWLMEKIQKH